MLNSIAPTGGAELAVDGPGLALDGIDGYVQFAADLVQRQRSAQQPQHTFLVRRERLGSWAGVPRAWPRSFARQARLGLVAARDCGQRRDRVFDPAELLDASLLRIRRTMVSSLRAASVLRACAVSLWMRAVVSASEMVEAMVASRYSSTLPCGWSAGPAWLRGYHAR